MPSETQAAGPRAPRLVIDARAAALGGVDPGQRLLGLSLIERLGLSARRSGYGEIVVIAPDADAAALRTLMPRIGDVAFGARLAEGADGPARTVVAPANVIGERKWLEAAATMPLPEDGSVALGGGVAVFGPRASIALAAQADATRPQVGAEAVAPMRITSPDDLAAAESRLVRALGKSTDGFMERNVERPVSRILSRRLVRTRITPNQMTLVSGAVGLAAAPFFLSAAPLWQTVGALIFLAHSILDGCDGELARLKFQESRWGGILDFWGDNIVHAAIFGCMALGWSLSIGADWPLALGAAAVIGALGSASFVYWRVMRPKRGEGPLYVSVARERKSRLVGMLDSLSRRDFIYLVLALSLFGKAAWFLALAAVGAPIFFAMLLFVAAQEARASTTRALSL